MKRPLQAEEARLWAVIAATVRPLSGRTPPVRSPLPAPATPPPSPSQAVRLPATSLAKPFSRPAPAPRGPDPIEPGRRRRIGRERDPIEGRVDLHGLDQERARTRLTAFLLDAQDRGARSVLVITGKGIAGQGVLRRRAPEWLADPRLRGVVAGVAPAETHHGGEGAVYVALKRKAR